MYAGPFFFFLAMISYGICHLVASQTSARVNDLNFHKMLFNCSNQDILDAIGTWVDLYDEISFYKNTGKEIIIESKPQWNSFGGFYYFHFSEINGNLAVSIGTKPKLIGDTREQDRFIEGFRDHVFQQISKREAA